MFADTLYRLERTHLLLVASWGAVAMLLGAATIVGGWRQPMFRQFGLQMLAWGALIAAISGLRWNALTLRDVRGATTLDRIIWLGLGLDLGLILTGVALAITAQVLERREGVLGAGLAIAINGVALAALDGRFASLIVR